LKEFSFGKAWFYNDTSNVIGLNNDKDKDGVVNANYFYSIANTKVDGNLIEKVLEADEIKYIWLSNLEIKDFFARSFFKDSMDSINKSIWIIQSNFTDLFYLKKIRFKEPVSISGNNFYSRAWLDQIDSCVFENHFTANTDSFLLSNFTISNSIFNDDVQLRDNFYKYSFEITNSKFDSSLDLSASNFQSELLIQDSKIRNLTIRQCSFNRQPNFRRIELIDTVDFSNIDFEKGIDLRRIDFQKASTIYLDNTSYPLGELIVYWTNIKGKDKPKISLKYESGNAEDDYKSIEDIYLQIKNNFLAQGDKASADDVAYELAWQKEMIVGGFWQCLYGVALGYGYQPIKFILFPISISIIFFWIVWYKFYYHIVAYVLNKDLDKDLDVAQHVSNVKFKLIKKKHLKILDHSKTSPEINRITRLWHTLHFSVSVLLGIRFKKDWIRVANKNKTDTNYFLWVTTFEYILGKIYLIFLILLIRIHTFENWKSFLGL